MEKKYKILICGQTLLMTRYQIENLDVSEMTSMKGMFSLAPDFDADLSKWDVSKVSDVSEMFKNCTPFNKEA